SRGLPPYRHNLVWQIFTNHAKRRLYVDWAQVAQHVIEEFRAEIEPYHGSSEVSTLIADPRAASSEFRGWREQHAVQGSDDRRKVLQPAQAEPIELEYVTLRLAVQPSLKLVVYMAPEEAAGLPHSAEGKLRCYMSGAMNERNH